MNKADSFRKFWIKCPPEFYDQISKKAEEEGLSLGDLAISKILNLKVEKIDTIEKRKHVVNGKEYIRKVVVTKKEYIPITEEKSELVTSGQEG